MRYIKWGLVVVLLAGAVGFLNYYLPQRDIVQIVGTDIKRADGGTDPVTGAQISRDVRYINARTASGAPRVYRNEDTGWGWPPYGKFNSGDLTARAQGLAGTDTWVALSHYGWRVQLFDMFPNALKIRQVDGPDVSLVPWFNIVFLIGLAIVVLLIWGWWQRFRARRIDPVLEDIGDGVEAVGDHAEGLWKRMTRFLGGGRR